MDYRIKGKCGFVTAGAHGIGEATADLLTQEGVHVIVADRDAAALHEKAHRWQWRRGRGSGNARRRRARDCLMYSPPLEERPISWLTISVWAIPGSFEELSDERWAKSFEINLMGCIRTCRTLVPKMAELGGASVVNTASDLAKQPEPTLMDYGTCKAGLLYFSKALAVQYAPGVRVNTVLPGPIWTQMWTRPGGIVDQLVESYGVDKEAALERFLKDRYMPLGIGQPEDVAQAIVFLASPLAKYITGATLDIGGTLRGLI